MEHNDPEHSEFIEVNEDELETGLTLAESALPEKLHVIPISNKPFFPAQIQPIVVDEEPWASTLEQVAHSSHRCLALCYAVGARQQF